MEIYVLYEMTAIENTHNGSEYVAHTEVVHYSKIKRETKENAIDMQILEVNLHDKTGLSLKNWTK